MANDPFTDGDRANTNGGDPKGLVYYKGTAASTLNVSDDSAGIGTGNALFFSPSGNGQKVIANFPPATLAGAGECLRVTFDFRFAEDPPNLGDGLRLGVYDSNGTRQSSDGQSSSIRTDDKGYAIAFNPSGAGFHVRKETAGDDILGGSAPNYFSALTSSVSGKMAPCGTSKHTLSLLITRQANGDLHFVAQFDAFLPATGTLAAAAVVAEGTYTLDEFAFGFSSSSGAARPIYVDNLRIVHGAAGAVAFTAPTPAPDAVFTLPATIQLTATGSDPDGIARIEFHSGRTKIGEAASAPYTFDWTDAGPGVHSLTAVLVDSDGEKTISSPVEIRATGGTPDEFDLLRERWLAMITGGTDYNPSDPGVASRITAITNSAQTQWNNMLKTGGNGRAYLWNDAASPTDSRHISDSAERLRTMARAYATTGSALQGNAALLADIEGGLDWLYANRYHENVTPYDNWWDWEIGTPQNLCDVIVLLYDQLAPVRFMNQMRAIERFCPTADYVTFSNAYNTGANRTWKARVVAWRGVLVKDGGKLAEARDSLSPVFPYVTSGDGFYADGSFIQHIRHPYAGGYGASLIDSLGTMLAMLQGSTWEVTDPNLGNLYRWIHEAFDPFLFRGAFMDCLRGREISRSGTEEHARGRSIITSILRIATFAPPEDALAFKRIAKAHILADTYQNFLTSGSLPAFLLAREVLDDSGITPRPELVAHRQFPGMDRAVHWRPGFAFALSLSSSRIYNYESINGENLRGWHTGDGAAYLYNADIDAYSSGYWPTVNPYRLAGTTVDTRSRSGGAQQSTLSPFSWVGGAEILGLYGASGMELQARDSTLTARKSWFMFDDEIVALGSGITSTDNRAIETIIENRRLKVAASSLTVDGVAKPTTYPWSETMTGIGWAHLEATGGYVFPGGATIKGLREARTGAWQDINAGGSATPVTRDYATLWFDHGSNPANAGYSYILLPNQNAAQTAAYAAQPHIVILGNTATAHGVREQVLGLTAANFWEDGEHSVGLITSDKKSAVLVREAGAQMDVSLSDPTQLNTGLITVELARAATGVASHDPRITVLQLSPAVRFTADVNGAAGKSLKASFTLQATSPPTIAAPAGGFTPLTLLAGTDGAAVLPDYTAQAVTSDDVGVTSVTQSPLPGATLHPGVTGVTLTAFDGDGNSASLSFDVTVLFPPIITAQPQNLTVAAGRNAQFSVTATGNAPFDYQWHHNNEPLSDSATVTGANTPVLQLAAVGAASAGNYSVTVSNIDGGTASETAVLTVDTSAPSGTIVSDSFTDGDRSNAIGGDPLGAVWYQSGTTPDAVSIVDDSAGIGSGNALRVEPPGNFYKMITFFTATTLAAAGETIRVTFDYRFPTAPLSAGGGFRVGLGHSAGTQQSSDGNGGTPGRRTDDKVYGFFTNAGATSATGTGLRYENAGDDILGGGSPGDPVPFGTNGGAVASGTTKHSAMLQITRLGNGDLDVQARIDNLTPARGTHAAGEVLTYTFDEFAFGFSGTNVPPAILVDNVTVSATTANVLDIAATDPDASRIGLDPAAFTVTRSSAAGALSVPYTIGGTAVNGVDYETISGVVEFADGQASATITITPLAAPFLETGKTVILTLSEPAGALAQNATATATIADALTVASGQIEPAFSELYTFYVTAELGARLWIDDRLVVARAFAQAGEMRGQARLTAGQRVNYRIESFGSGASWEWSSFSQAREVIPPERLFPERREKAGGSILKEHWSGLPGAALTALTAHANYPDKPGGRELLTAFECLARDWADSYGTRVTGFIVPPATGDYTFAASGDEAVELYLSPDENAANKTLIASVTSATAFRQWDAQPSQQSGAIPLVRGQRYYVELRHKEDTGSDHWSVAWKKPGESVFAVIPGSALVQAGLGRAQPAQANWLATLAQDHPRLFATPERFAWLKAVWQSAEPSQPKIWAQSAINSANNILGQPPVTYTPSDRNSILEQARTVKERMYFLGLAWWLTGHSQYAERAWTELDTVADNTLFPDWNAANSFLDTAEMTHAAAIGYDWFYPYWTPARRGAIRTAIINKGLTPGLAQYTANVGWSRPTGNNWNQVCNGGMSLGALAVGMESEALVEEILHRATNSLRPLLERYTTDNGAWYEGPGYWTYAGEYLVRHLAGLEWALGSDFGLSGTRLFSETGFYPAAMTGPNNVSFYHSDSGSGRVHEDGLQWLARRFNQPLYAWYENTYGSGVLDALWWQDAPVSLAAAGFTPDFAFHGEAGTPFKPVEVVTLRTNWTDPRATFLGCKGGWMGADHGNLDAGTFVLDALGRRWFHELGPDNYSLPGYFSNTPNPAGHDRWDYYRNRAEGQNTLLVAPGAGPDMAYNTVAPLIAYQSSPGGRRAQALFDLTPCTPGVTRLWRGFQLLGARNQVLIQDEIIAPAGREVWWFAHYTHPATTVTIEPGGTSALLQQGAERLWVKIVSGEGAAFQIMDATPLPTSPNPITTPQQNPNTGFKKLAIHLSNVTHTTLALWMAPLAPGENPPETLPAITPLNTWNPSATNEPPVTPDAVVTAPGDQAVEVDLRAYATDDATPSEALVFSAGNAVNGAVELLADGHTARFTPAPGQTGMLSFDYTATDEGGLSSTGTLAIAAAAVTQAWTATSSGVWSAGANWSTGIAPVSSRGNTLIFFTGQTLAANVTANNDLGPFQLNVLTLAGSASAAAAATLSGGALTLIHNGPLNPVANLDAATGSGFAYDVNTPLILAAATTFQGNGSAAFRFHGNLSGAGALTKSGSSTLILTGANSYTGGTTLHGGTLQIGDNTATGTLPAGAVTNNGVLRFHRSDSALTVANAINGTGGIQLGVTSGGAVTAITTLSGASSFTGNVAIRSGGLRVTHSSALGAGAKSITLNTAGGNPHLRLDGSAGGIDLPAAFSFSTSNNDAANGAILNEAGDNIIRGGFTLTGGNGNTRLISAAGTLTLTGHFTPSMAGRHLVLDGAGAGVITGTIRDGSGANTLLSVTKSNAGVWTLGGLVEHSGTVAVNGGTLIVNGTINGPSAVTVAAAAALAGSGSIAANTTISGTHQPGAGIGAQTFTGALSYGSASRLVWELGANLDTGAGANFDQVNAATVSITSNAALDVSLNSPGSAVDFTDPFWSQSRAWTVLTTSSPISGVFKLGTVSADSAGRGVSGFGAFSLQHTGTAVNLVWTPATPYQQWKAAWFGADWNQPAIAGDLADPNHNGLANLLEYALGGHPLQNSGASILPVVGKHANGHLTLSFQRFLSRSDLILTVQGTDTLESGEWADLARSTGGAAFIALEQGVSVSETGSGDTRAVTVSDQYPISDPDHPRRFLRLKVAR